MSLNPDVRAVLLKVRDEILTDESKWAQDDDVCLATTPTCLGMAIAQALAAMGLMQCHGAVNRALGFMPGESIVPWNDAPERTFADVRARLDAAIGGGL